MKRGKILALVLAAGCVSGAAASGTFAATTINIYTGGGYGARPAIPGTRAPGVPGAPVTAYSPAPVTAAPAAPVAVAPSAAALDGNALYTQYCSSCHGSSERNASASSIQSAISGNKGGMGSLRSLTPAQINAIAGGSGAAASGSTKKKKD